MSDSLKSAPLDRELSAVKQIIADLQRRWPSAIVLEPDRRSDYYALPYCFIEAFPSLVPSDLRPLAAFCKLYAGSILLHDQLIDGELPSSIATPSLRILAMQAEAYHLLHALFPATSVFWERLRSYLGDYAEACVDEQRYVTGSRPWSEYTEPVASRIVIGKNGLARIIVAGMCELARDESLFEPLLEITNAFNMATQMWDDLQDWKEDLRRGAPSLVLSRLVNERPGSLDDEAWRGLIQRLARELYYGGHARDILDLVLRSLAAAERLKDTVPELGLHAVTAALRRQCEVLRADIERIVRANVQRARELPRVTLSLGEATAPWQEAAWGGLRFLEAQWNLGFGEGRDLMQYPAGLGLDAGDTCCSGDVFQRALLVDALCDADRVLDGRLQPMIEREVRYLVSQRSDSTTGGWRYYMDLPELPPDADSLAQVIQALLRGGQRDAVAQHGEPPLAVLLRDNSHLDGSFETWIVPATGRTALETRHAELVERVWGMGADCDVIPNLLYALHVYDAARFAEVIRKGAAYLEGQQREDGTWASRWYAGSYYAVFVCLRFLSAARPAAPAVTRALQMLRDTQRRDGGWGIGDAASDPLSTALALLGLSAGHRAYGEAADLGRAERGIAALRSAMDAAGGWPAQKLIFKGLRTFHGSRTLTTTFVLKAALAWRCDPAQIGSHGR